MTAELDGKITTSLVDGALPCPVAFDVASEVKVSRQKVGEAANRLDIRIHDCQLGCFGSKKATHDELEGKQVNQTIAEKVKDSLIDGCLPCPVAFKIANALKVTAGEVGDTATMMQIKVNKCQLGCFP